MLLSLSLGCTTTLLWVCLPWATPLRPCHTVYLMLCVIMEAISVYIHDLHNYGVSLLTHEPRGLLDVATAVRLNELPTMHCH